MQLSRKKLAKHVPKMRYFLDVKDPVFDNALLLQTDALILVFKDVNVKRDFEGIPCVRIWNCPGK